MSLFTVTILAAAAVVAAQNQVQNHPACPAGDGPIPFKDTDSAYELCTCGTVTRTKSRYPQNNGVVNRTCSAGCVCDVANAKCSCPINANGGVMEAVDQREWTSGDPTPMVCSPDDVVYSTTYYRYGDCLKDKLAVAMSGGRASGWSKVWCTSTGVTMQGYTGENCSTALSPGFLTYNDTGDGCLDTINARVHSTCEAGVIEDFRPGTGPGSGPSPTNGNNNDDDDDGSSGFPMWGIGLLFLIPCIIIIVFGAYRHCQNQRVADTQYKVSKVEMA